MYYKINKYKVNKVCSQYKCTYVTETDEVEGWSLKGRCCWSGEDGSYWRLRNVGVIQGKSSSVVRELYTSYWSNFTTYYTVSVGLITCVLD